MLDVRALAVSRLTPIDIQHAEFTRRAGGYDRREVKAFLERLALEVEESLKAAQSMRRRLGEAEDEIERLRTAEAELQQVVLAAERIATDLKENAKREAQLIVEDAERMRQARFSDIEASLLRARGELERVTQQRRLFKEQFRGLLAAYSAALAADDAQAPATDAPLSSALLGDDAPNAATLAATLLDDTVGS
ncbi:MAG TPA: DivIVA domain-containing protein [Trueperaceae bacterium]|nr:DivIVA domain-containing protein [Trueperaceae bacterium]